MVGWQLADYDRIYFPLPYSLVLE